MRTSLLQKSSGIFLFIIGLICTFLSDNLLLHFGVEALVFPILIVQLFGGALLSFGIINYYTQNILIGGIYGRALVLGNLLYYFNTSITLIKWIIKFEPNNQSIFVLACIHFTFFCLYTLKLKTSSNPNK